MNELLQKYTNAQSRFCVIEGALVHYRDEGEGIPLILIHGTFSSLHTFDGWIEELKDKYRLIRLDLPGFGLSGTPLNNHFSINSYLRVLEEFVDLMELDSAHVAGSSLGGWLAWEFALKFPEKVKRLILIGAAGFLDQASIPLPFKMARTPLVNRIIRYVVKRNVVELFLKQVYGDPSKVTEDLLDRYYDLFARGGNPQAFLALANGKYKDNTLHLKQIHHPTLILWGKDDMWLPVENAYKFHGRIPDSELIIYEGLGHVPMEEDAYLTALDVWAFLSRPEAVKAQLSS